MDDRSKPQLPDAIQCALHQIRQHPHVVDVGVSERIDGNYLCTVHIRINLPAKWRSQGQSPNGVRAVEAVEFHFPDNYPTNPPDIQLRNDFDRCLAHIQPGKEGASVRPCYFEGNARELLHQSGILTLTNQIVDWLDKAATGELIDYRQGWEPIRRDSVNDILVADLTVLRGLVKPHDGQAHFKLQYQRLAKAHLLVPGRLDSTIYARLDPVALRIDANVIEKQMLLRERSYSNSNYSIGQSIALLAYPGKTHVCAEYQPDTIQNLEQLCNRAAAYGCRTVLEQGLNHLRDETHGFQSTGNPIPVILLLCARRPTHLIGSDSRLEIIAYKIENYLPLFKEPWNMIQVHPVSLMYSIGASLLRRISGLPSTLTPVKSIMLGCGSLGSKLALHLARAGIAPKTLVDNDFFMPHNAARHGLISVDYVERKSVALAEAIQTLGQQTQPLHRDIIDVVNADKELRALLKDKHLVINSTASLAVRNALSALPNKKLPVRISESILFARGAAGVMTLEGEKRNPNTSDVMLEVYEYARNHAHLRQALFSENALARQAVGQGCGSMTMQMPDTDISVYAATMGGKLLEFQQKGLPKEARFWIGIKAESDMAPVWVTETVPPYSIVQADNDSRWAIRISSRASAKILTDCQLYPHVETGGIVVGAVSEARKAITIVDVLPAPDDSTRTPVKFTLGMQGVKNMLKDYGAPIHYALTCIGTWHSHLINVGASRQDYQTAAVIAGSTPEISVLLIKTPKGFRAIVADSSKLWAST